MTDLTDQPAAAAHPLTAVLPRRPSLRRRVLSGVLRGAVAGAAGTTALNAVTYLDMAVRGRGSSSTPEETVETLADQTHVRIPGDEETEQNRVSGLGPLLGVAAGVGTGAAVGAVYGLGLRLPWPLGGLLAAAGAMAGANGPMALLGISDPTSWSAEDWVADVVPHAAYGAVTGWTLRRLT